MIHQVVEILKWNYSNEINEAWRYHLDHLCFCLGQYINQHRKANKELADLILSLIRAANDSELEQIITSPELASLILNDVASDSGMEALKSSLLDPSSILSRRATLISVSGIHHDIRIDGHSAFARQDFFCENSNMSYDWGATEYERITENLARALHIIRFVPNAHKMICRFTKVIVIRKNPAYGYYSSSSRSYPTVQIITNPQLMSVDDIIDSVVHEAIHSFLYSIELIHPFIIDRSIENTFKLVSPWSGQLLPLHSYIHACFVWYGLYFYWMQHDGASQIEATKKRRRAQQGFLKEDLAKNLGSVCRCLHADLLKGISSMQEIVSSLQGSDSIPIRSD